MALSLDQDNKEIAATQGDFHFAGANQQLRIAAQCCNSTTNRNASIWPLKLKTILTKVSCSTAIAGCRANPLEATQPISENPKFWSNQTGLTSCLKWLSWIWISFFVWNPVRERYWIDHFVRIRYHTDVRALFPKDSIWHHFSVACLTSTLGIEDVWSHGSPGTTAQRSFFQQSLLRREGKPFDGVN